MEEKDIQMDQKFSYDERRKILKSVVTKKNNNIDSTYTDVFNEEGIKNLFNNVSNDKKRIQNQINQIEKLISENKDKIDSYKKVLPELSESQKKLIEDIKAISQYDNMDKLEEQIKHQKNNIDELKKNLKKSNEIINELKTKVKFKLG